MILEEIVRRTQERVFALPESYPGEPHRKHVGLAQAIRSSPQKNPIIAEIKCASPSQGTLRPAVDMAAMARDLVSGGCIAISVLTEPDFFKGDTRHIALVKTAVSVPVLRKDFIIDTRQLDETRALGADAVLLIAGILGHRLEEFVDRAGDMGLEPLIEVHNGRDVEAALSTKAEIIGINNRDLSTLKIDRSTTRLLSGRIRAGGRLVVSESGMRSAEDVREIRPFCDAFLIGSAIMAHDQPKKKLEEFICA